MINKKIGNAPLGEKIKEARIANGYTITELAEKVGVSRQMVSKYELGLAQPSVEVFDSIVLFLGFPIDFYLKDDKLATQEESVIFYRSLKSAERRNRDICNVRARWMNKLITFIGQYIRYPEVNLPDLEDRLIKDEYTIDDMEKITLLVREYWGLGQEPVDNLAYILEKNGFIITHIKINDDKIDAFSSWIGDRPVIFLGSDKECAARTNFDMAHELGHNILHRYIHKEELSDPKLLKKIEKQANLFAAAFLLPKEQFGNEVLSTNLDYFIMLKRRWKVSIQAMIYRCHELEYISDDQVLYLRKKIAKLGYRKNEPLDNEIEISKPIILNQAVTMLLEEKILSKKQIRELINIPINILEQLLTLEDGYLEDSERKVELRLNVVRAIRS